MKDGKFQSGHQALLEGAWSPGSHAEAGKASEGVHAGTLGEPGLGSSLPELPKGGVLTPRRGEGRWGRWHLSACSSHPHPRNSRNVGPGQGGESEEQRANIDVPLGGEKESSF